MAQDPNHADGNCTLHLTIHKQCETIMIRSTLQSHRTSLVTCLVAFPSSTCLTFCPNSSVLMVSGMLESRGLIFTNMQAWECI